MACSIKKETVLLGQPLLLFVGIPGFECIFVSNGISKGYKTAKKPGHLIVHVYHNAFIIKKLKQFSVKMKPDRENILDKIHFYFDRSTPKISILF